eukprot:9487386-Pyramimonas_sp.AAC.1
MSDGSESPSLTSESASDASVRDSTIHERTIPSAEPDLEMQDAIMSASMTSEGSDDDDDDLTSEGSDNETAHLRESSMSRHLDGSIPDDFAEIYP